MSVVRVGPEGQVTIPETVLAKLGAGPGQDMMLVEREGAVLLSPLPGDPVGFLCGALAGQPSANRELMAERAEDLLEGE